MFSPIRQDAVPGEFTHFLARFDWRAKKKKRGNRTAAKAIAEKPETETTQLLPGFAEFFDTDDG